MKVMLSTYQNMGIQFSRSLQFLTATRKRGVILVPLALVAAYATGFGAVKSVMVVGNFSGSSHQTTQLIPLGLQVRLLSLVPAAYAAAIGPQPCTGTCDALSPASYSTTSDFYTNGAGVDFTFMLPGEPNVGYLHISSPDKTVTKRFD